VQTLADKDVWRGQSVLSSKGEEMRSEDVKKLPAILLVDDHEGYRFLVQFALNKSGLKASLQCVADGAEALMYLSRKGRFKDEVAFPFPSIVLLDLNTPGLNGFEILKWKSSRPELQFLPFVVLGTLDSIHDRRKAAELGACDYLVKSISTPDMVNMILGLEKFWRDGDNQE
jgi:CheY-like chemotaxis protein